MTDIDLNRLAVDRGYWDERATWKGARYYCANSGRFNTPHEWPCDSCIPRPTKQERAGEGSAKHVGMKFQTSLGKCELMAIDSNKVTCCVKMDDSGHLSFCSLDALMPVRTQHDRQRDELVDLVGKRGSISDSDIADAILSRYNLEPKP